MVQECLNSANGSFTLLKVDHRGLSYKIKSNELAEKYVVDIRFDYKSINDFDYDYTKLNIFHGMRNTIESIAETKEYIDVLQEAVDFTYQVCKYIADNPIKI